MALEQLLTKKKSERKKKFDANALKQRSFFLVVIVALSFVCCISRMLAI